MCRNVPLVLHSSLTTTNDSLLIGLSTVIWSDLLHHRTIPDLTAETLDAFFNYMFFLTLQSATVGHESQLFPIVMQNYHASGLFHRLYHTVHT